MFPPSSDINPCHSLYFDRDHLRFVVQFGNDLRSASFAVLGSFADESGFLSRVEGRGYYVEGRGYHVEGIKT